MNYKVKTKPEAYKVKSKSCRNFAEALKLCWEINSFPLLKIMKQLKEDNVKTSKMIREVICELYLIASHIKNKKRSHWGVPKK